MQYFIPVELWLVFIGYSSVLIFFTFLLKKRADVFPKIFFVLAFAAILFEFYSYTRFLNRQLDSPYLTKKHLSGVYAPQGKNNSIAWLSDGYLIYMGDLHNGLALPSWLNTRDDTHGSFDEGAALYYPVLWTTNSTVCLSGNQLDKKSKQYLKKFFLINIAPGDSTPNLHQLSDVEFESLCSSDALNFPVKITQSSNSQPIPEFSYSVALKNGDGSLDLGVDSSSGTGICDKTRITGDVSWITSNGMRHSLFPNTASGYRTKIRYVQYRESYLITDPCSNPHNIGANFDYYMLDKNGAISKFNGSALDWAVTDDFYLTPVGGLLIGYQKEFLSNRYGRMFHPLTSAVTYSQRIRSSTDHGVALYQADKGVTKLLNGRPLDSSLTADGCHFAVILDESTAFLNFNKKNALYSITLCTK